MFKILCVDDSPEIHILVKRIFSDTAEVHTAENLKEAQDQMCSHSIDLILLDLSLPDGDGIDFFQIMNDSERYAQIPVIILSSKSNMVDKLTGFYSGAEDYIVKPFDPMELKLRAITRIRRHSHLRTATDL